MLICFHGKFPRMKQKGLSKPSKKNELMLKHINYYHLLLSWELTYPCKKGTFEDDFPFPPGICSFPHPNLPSNSLQMPRWLNKVTFIAPEKLPSQKESSLPTIQFQGAMLNFGSVPPGRLELNEGVANIDSLDAFPKAEKWWRAGYHSSMVSTN